MIIEQALPKIQSRWYEIWLKVIFSPRASTFEDILFEGNVTARRAFIWLLSSSLVVGVLGAIPTLMGGMVNPGSLASHALLVMALAVVLNCGLPAGEAVICHGFSRLMGGSGTWTEMFYCLAAVNAPTSIIITVLEVAFPSHARILAPLNTYILWLTISAIMGAEKVGWVKSIIIGVILAGAYLFGTTLLIYLAF